MSIRTAATAGSAVRDSSRLSPSVINRAASVRRPHHIGRRPVVVSVRHRLRPWVTWLRVACGVLVGTGLVAAVLAAPVAAGVVKPTSPVATPDDGYQWPLDGTPLVTRRFDPPPKPWQSGHRGVDLAGQPDDTVRAAGSGVVYFAGSLAGRGVVSIHHPNGLRTTYEPIEPLIAVGARIRAGELLGRLSAGHPACPAAACLHWGLRQGNDYLDPLSLLGLGQVRLLPMTVSPGKLA